VISEKTPSQQLSLLELTWIVARDVNRTLGGGLASMELLRRTFIANGSIDDAGNAGLIAVSRLTPGTNILAYAVGLGWLLHRWAGALVSVVAASLPASLVICVLTVALVQVQDYPVVRMLLAIGVLVATLLVFASAGSLLRPYVRRSARVRSAIVAAVATALLLADVTPVRILLLAAVVGAVIGGSAQPLDTAE
jgi:chromate transport protein ChrA